MEDVAPGKRAKAAARRAEKEGKAAKATEEIERERKQHAQTQNRMISIMMVLLSVAGGALIKVRQQSVSLRALQADLNGAQSQADEARATLADALKAVAASAAAATDAGDGAVAAMAVDDAASAAGSGCSCVDGGDDAYTKIRRPASAREMLMMGGIFLEPHVSEILMERPVQVELGFDNVTWVTERWVAGSAIDIISVPVSTAERAAGALTAATRAVVVDYVRELGVAVLPALLDAEACRELAAWVKAALVDPDHNANGLGGIAEAEFRFDYPVEAEAEPVQRVMREALGFYGGALEDLVGANATLEELSTITSVPGATQQGKHPDMGMDEPRNINDVQLLVTSFVALADVGTDQAALDLWPATHTHCHFLYNAEKEMLVSAPAVRLTVPAGSVVVMDSRTYHRGTANTSPKDRPVMYFSFMSSDPARGRPKGPTFTMLPRYRGRITLDDARKGVYPQGLTEADDVLNPLVHASSVLKMTREERVRMAYNAAHGAAREGVKYGKDDTRPGRAMARDEPVYTMNGHQTEAEALASDALVINDGAVKAVEAKKAAPEGGGGRRR